VIVEYLYDGLGEGEIETFQNDIVFGARVALNNSSSSEASASITTDLDDGSLFFNAQASHRLGDSYVLGFEATTFPSEHYIGLTLTRHF